MSWENKHPRQKSTREIVITEAEWSELSPFFQDDSSTSLISSAIMDPLIWYDSDLSV